MSELQVVAGCVVMLAGTGLVMLAVHWSLKEGGPMRTQGGQYDPVVEAIVSHAANGGGAMIYTFALCDECHRWWGDASAVVLNKASDWPLLFRDRCECYLGLFAGVPDELVDTWMPLPNAVDSMKGEDDAD